MPTDDDVQRERLLAYADRLDRASQRLMTRAYQRAAEAMRLRSMVSEMDGSQQTLADVLEFPTPEVDP